MDKNTLNEENEQILADKVPDNYLGFATVCTIVCFAPLGIFALFFSLRVNQLWEEGKKAKARRMSVVVRHICVWTIILGFIFWIGILAGTG